MNNNQSSNVYSIVDARPMIFNHPSGFKLADQEKNVIIKNNDGFNDREVDMDARIDKLEKRADSIESTLSRLNETMLKLDSKIDLQTAKLESAIALQSSKLEVGMALQSSKLESMISLQGAELKASIENQKTEFDGKLKDMRLSIILWILGLPSLFFAIYKIYEILNIKH
ncbi:MULTISPECIES: hypothetical protein [Xenorhabdus]|uniref:hypothetical protein n=1 Tax=Xenorhabdus TaxID=626 RepID=UPI0006493B47|nr:MULTISPECIES: hypothetical protein [Xenorhabdus]KLU14039.1 hypothetical protein AAY47_18695 [Xenorhabdus griffiniae]KOP31915.1 hypothetical protein AFK69_18305 [Xenorhabdus sp. GDc328]